MNEWLPSRESVVRLPGSRHRETQVEESVVAPPPVAR